VAILQGAGERGKEESMKRNRSFPRAARVGLAAAGADLLARVMLAAPAAAQGVIATGSGRAGASIAALTALGGVAAGGLALARSGARSPKTRSGRDAAIVALVLALMGIALSALHLATSSGGIGTGNGRAGAIVALLLGGIGIVLGRRALVRTGATA